MTVIASKVTLPEHELTIQGTSDGKVGSCCCGGWFVARQATSDDVSVQYFLHLVEVGAAMAVAS